VSKFTQQPPPIPPDARDAPKSEILRPAARVRGEETSEGLAERARSLEASGQSTQAAELLEDGARRFVERGLVHEALELFEQALVLDPSRADLFEETAKTYQQLGRFEAALTCYEGALRAYHNSQRSEQARQVLDRMMRFDLEDPNRCYQLSRACKAVGMTEKAATLLKRCLDHYEHEKQRAKFLATAEELVSMTPEADAVRVRVVAFLLEEASVFMRYRLFDKAIQGVRDALEWDSESVDAREFLVKIYESADRGNEAVQALLDLARNTRDRRQVCEAYLWRAVEAAAEPAAVFDAARELGFDLFKMGDGTLGDEPTSTEDDEEADDASAQVPTTRTTINSSRFGTNLLKLLQHIESIQVATVLEIGPSASGQRAELLVQNGAIVFGVTINGEFYNDPGQIDEGEALGEALEACRHQERHQWLGVLATLARNPRIRHTLRLITASALLELSKIFAGQPFEVASRPCDTLPTVLSFSLFDLVKLCVQREAAEPVSSVAVSYFDSVKDEVEQAWLIRRNAMGQPIPLPEQAVAALNTGVENIESLGLAMSRIAALTERLLVEGDDSQSRCLVLFTDEGPWCCVIDPTSVALALTRTSALGPFLSRARAYCEGTSEVEVAP
jgi:tetratricopeptide (TPR) repeat protein